MTTQTCDDIALLQQIAHERSAAALSQLWERHCDRAFNLALGILQDRARAEDALQDALLTVWMSKPDGQVSDVRQWILRIVLGKSLNLRRSAQRSARREKQMSSKPDDPADVSAVCELSEATTVLQRQLKALPQLERELLACSFGAGLSHRDIAGLMGLPHQTVSQKIQRALERLRSELKTAGLAALPLALLERGLTDALTTGQRCPSRILARVLEGHGATTATSGAPTAAGHNISLVPRALLGAGIVALLGIGAFRYCAKTNASAAPNPPVAVPLAQLGSHLDDERLWHAYSALSLDRNPERLTVHLATPPGKETKPTLVYFGGVVQTDPLELPDGQDAVSCKLTFTVPTNLHTDIYLYAGLAKTKQPIEKWVLGPFENTAIRIAYSGKAVARIDLPAKSTGCIRVLDPYHRDSPDRPKGDEYFGQKPETHFPFMTGQLCRSHGMLGQGFWASAGRHTVELILNRKELFATCDGETFYRGPHEAPAMKFVRFALMAAVESEYQDATQAVTFENIEVAKSSALRP